MVEGIGTNFYLDRNEFIEVKVKSSITSSNGITIKLMEISENTNIYRGVFSLKDVSKEFSSELGVRKNNEVIEAIVLDNTNIRDRLIFIDTSPPSAPQIYANFIYPAQNTFEHNLDNWQNRCGETGAKVEKVQRVRNNYCIKITSQVDRGNSSVYVLQKSFSAKEFPIIQFDYKIPPYFHSNFLFKVNGIWKNVVFTDPENICLSPIGKIEGIITDNQWHTAKFNLYEMLKKIILTLKIIWSKIDDYGNWIDIKSTPMKYNVDIDNNDEYIGTIGPLPLGEYEFTVRF